MGLFEHWPYTNFHDLNLDWIIKKIKNVETAEINTAEYAEQAKASEEAAAESEANAKTSEDNAEAFSLSAEASKNAADDIVENTIDQINLLQSRVDNIIPQGTQTEGNTELLDIRVAYDGTTYSSAGDAVRGQASGLNDKIIQVTDNTSNIFFFTNKTNRTVSDVSMIFESDDVAIFNGTASGNIPLYLFGDTSRTGTSLPAGTYYVKFELLSGTMTPNSISYRFGSNQTTWINGVHTSTEDATLFVRLASGGEFNNAKLRFWISVSDEPTEYVPHPTAKDAYARNKVEELKNTVYDLAEEDADINYYHSLKYFAHRGDTSAAADNSTLAYAAAQKNGYYGVETDVRKTSDNVYIMVHDQVLTDINGIRYTIADTPWTTLKECVFVSNGVQYKLITLDDALRMLKMMGLRALIEIKQTAWEIASGIVQKVIDNDMQEYTIFNIGGSAARLQGVVAHIGEGQINIETAYYENAENDYLQYLNNDQVSITFGIGKETFTSELITIEHVRELESQGFHFYYVANTESEIYDLLGYYPNFMEIKTHNMDLENIIYTWASEQQ